MDTCGEGVDTSGGAWTLVGRAWTLLTTVISDYIVTMVTMVELCRSIRKGHVGGFMHALLLNFERTNHWASGG